jgi:hypothetical protein
MINMFLFSTIIDLAEFIYSFARVNIANIASAIADTTDYIYQSRFVSFPLRMIVKLWNLFSQMTPHDVRALFNE